VTESWIERPDVQDGMRRMLASRADLIAGGEGIIGWKLGFGAPNWLEKFAIPGPLVGFLPASRRHPPGATVSVEGWRKPVAEPEVAVFLGSDVDDPDQVASAVTAVAPAIELADVHPPPEDMAEVVAGNIFHRAVVLGDPGSGRAGADIAGLRAHVTRDGSEEAVVTDLEALTGELVTTLSHTARLLGAFGERLRAGEVVIMGSVTPPLPIQPGTQIGFRLAPLPTITVSV
jgi:2-keto-4-pentenoate hydratase